ncbi:unnamed protein product, partial [Meganyctiphanes norvegica]
MPTTPTPTTTPTTTPKTTPTPVMTTTPIPTKTPSTTSTTTTIPKTTTTTSITVTASTCIDNVSGNPSLPCTCGVVTKPNDNWHSLYNHPWTVALLDSSGGHFCSGTIINTMYILTARPCVEGRSGYRIRANEEVLGEDYPRAITRDPVGVQYQGELALLELNVAISLTQHDAVKPACLPNDDMDFAGDAATHSGYDHGKNVKNDGMLSMGGQENQLTFVPSGHPFCREDLGGPIVSNGYLAGIATDTTCGVTQVAAKVSSYNDWIIQNTQTGRFCCMK